MKSLLKFFLLLIILGVIAVGGAYFGLQWYVKQPNSLNAETSINIPMGTGFSSITAMLDSASIIHYPDLFKAYAMLEDKQSQFKAGEYIFEAGATPAEIMQKLIDGKSVTHSITVPEGWLTAQILAQVASEIKLTGDIPKGIKEGELLPETYHFLRGDTRESVIRRMRSDMQQTLDKLWQTRQEGLPLKTKQEALILASIVEKETGVKAERERVAAVFINRLRKGIKLQSDPTIIYGTYLIKGEYRKTIYRSEIDRKDKYNTYHIPALPPTPIAAVGRAAITAVLNPAKTDELFFVAKGDGGHIFSRTNAEHEANVAKYRAWQRKNGLR